MTSDQVYNKAVAEMMGYIIISDGREVVMPTEANAKIPIHAIPSSWYRKPLPDFATSRNAAMDAMGELELHGLWWRIESWIRGEDERKPGGKGFYTLEIGNYDDERRGFTEGIKSTIQLALRAAIYDEETEKVKAEILEAVK